MRDGDKSREELLGELAALRRRIDDLERDASARMAAEEALRESERRYREFIATSMQETWSYKIDPPMPTDIPCEEQVEWAFAHGVLDECNDIFARSLGFPSANEAIGLRFFEMTGHDQKESKWIIREWIEGGYEFDSAEIMETSISGEERWNLVSGASLINDGRVLRTWGTRIDITERKRAEEALRERDQALQAFVDSSKDWIWAINRDGIHTYSNPAVERILGYRPEEILGRANLELLHSEDRCAVAAQFPEWLSAENGWSNLLLRWKHKEGGYRYLESNAVPIWDDNGDLVGFRGVDRDVTERRIADESLRISEERYRTLFESANDAIFVMDEMRIVDCNPQGLKMFGCSAEEILNQTPIKFSPPRQPDGRESREKAMEMIKAASEGRLQCFEWRHSRYDGTPFDAEVSLTRFELSGRRQLLAIVRDITDRNEAQEALRSSENRFRTLVQNIPGVVYRCDTKPPWKMEHISEGVVGLTGHTSGDFMSEDGLSWNDVIVPEDRDHVASGVRQGVDDRESFEFEYRIRTAKGDVRWVRERGRAVYDDGNALWLDGAIFDVTNEKTLNRALRFVAQEEWRTVHDDFFTALVSYLAESLQAEYTYVGQLSSDGDTVTTVAKCVHGRIVENSTYRTKGTPCENVVGKKACYYPGDVRKRFPDDEMLTQTEAESYVGIPLWDSNSRPLGVLAALSCKPMERPTLEMSVVQVMAPRAAAELERRRSEEHLRRMETQLAHVSRLSTMGELVAGIAHEVNQPLYAIRNFANAGSNVLASGGEIDLDELREWNEGIGKAALHASGTVKRLREFVRRGEADRSFCRFDEVIEESIQLVAFQARRRRISVRRELEKPSPEVHVDRIGIQQVLVNLLQNSFEAIEESPSVAGEVLLRVKTVGGNVEISVADNGPGLPLGGDLKVFDAFITTKQEGLGMGLAIATTIVEAHGGKLWATTDQTTGATFHFTLPMTGEERIDDE